VNETHCQFFAEHKSDPCPCGWSSATDPQIQVPKLQAQLAAEKARADRAEIERDGLLARMQSNKPQRRWTIGDGHYRVNPGGED
jgi:hypothetical protein